MSVFRFGPASINHQVDSDSHESDEQIYAEAESRQSCFANLLFGTPARLAAEHEALAPRLVMCPRVEYKQDRRKRGGVVLFAENASKRRTAVADEDGGGRDDVEDYGETEKEPIVEERKIIELVDSQQPMSPADAAAAVAVVAAPPTPLPPPSPDESPCATCGFLTRKSTSCPACESFLWATNVASPPPIDAVADEERWICGACTFRNNKSLNACETCGSGRADERRFLDELAQLRSMGFTDDFVCMSLLLRFDGNMERVLNDILQ